MSDFADKIELVKESMDRLINCPCAKPFLMPVNVKNKEYYENISCPISLNQIMEKILLNRYEKLSQWKNDMYLIAKNACSYNGKNSYFAIMANRLVELFDKEYENILKNSEKYWLESFELLNRKMMNMYNFIPEPIKKASFLEKLILQNSNKKPKHNSNNTDNSNPTFHDNIKIIKYDEYEPFCPVPNDIVQVETVEEELIEELDDLFYKPIYYDEGINKYSKTFGDSSEAEPMFIVDFRDEIQMNCVPKKTDVDPKPRVENETENVPIDKKPRNHRVQPKSNKNDSLRQQIQKQSKNISNDTGDDTPPKPIPPPPSPPPPPPPPPSPPPPLPSPPPAEPNEPPKSNNDISEHDMLLFITACSMLDTRYDAIKMARIINSHQPDIDLSDCTPAIDLRHLNKDTLFHLIKYTKKQLKLNGNEYPS